MVIESHYFEAAHLFLHPLLCKRKSSAGAYLNSIIQFSLKAECSWGGKTSDLSDARDSQPADFIQIGCYLSVVKSGSFEVDSLQFDSFGCRFTRCHKSRSTIRQSHSKTLG